MRTHEGWLIAIDPGKDAGVAVFDSRHTLNSVWLLKHPFVLPWGLKTHDWSKATAVCEVPQIYRGSPVNKQSLLTLAFDAGFLTGLFNTCRRTLVHPRQWKGQTPKEADHDRTLKILDMYERRVLEEDLAKYPKSKRHNLLDAVGLGLWHLDRRPK